MVMQESGEMYLETIYVLSRHSSSVRNVDAAEEMGYSKPSVCRAVGLLRKDVLLLMDEAGELKLTEAGEEKAKRIYERHTVLSKLLMNLGVDEATANEDACRIEHYIADRKAPSPSSTPMSAAPETAAGRACVPVRFGAAPPAPFPRRTCPPETLDYPAQYFWRRRRRRNGQKSRLLCSCRHGVHTRIGGANHGNRHRPSARS
ncbi:MAG: metal-dependent transcriptional regulator [Oscillospiraceae bacterium]|nr:metal-dependent transcriptional regulator [Oscillospiraceae bacterium]